MLLVVAACAGDGDGSAPREGAATQPPASTAEPGVLEVPPTETAMEPGEYTYSPFEPRVTFRVGDGWEAAHQRPDFFDVWHESETAIGWARPAVVFGRDGPRSAEGMTPARAIRTLAANPAVTDVARPSETVMDAVPGTSLEFSTREGGELFGSSDGAAFQTAPPTTRFRVSAFEVAGELVLMLEMSVSPPHEASMRLADAVARTAELGS